MSDGGGYTDNGWAVRNALLSSQGAAACPLCPVITQGGQAGYQAHLATCHAEAPRASS